MSKRFLIYIQCIDTRGFLCMTVKNISLKTLFSLAVFLSAFSVSAQTPPRSDPTVLPPEMADSIRVQLTELRSLSIHALVVGADNDGIAILSAGPDLTLRVSAADAIQTGVTTVRAGSVIVLSIDSFPVRLVVKSVSASGVEIEAPTLTERLFISSGFKALTSNAPASNNMLRYVECKELPLETLLRLVADQSGANLSASADAAKEPVSVFLRNVSVDTAVEEVCRTRNLWYRKDDGSGITRVTTMEEYEKNLSSFREETTEVFTLLYPNVYELASVIYGLYLDRVVITFSEEGPEEEIRDISRRFERFSQITSGANSGLLADGASSSGGYGGGYGGGSSGGYGGSGSGGWGSSSRSGGIFSQYGSSGNILDLRSREAFSNLSANDAKQIEALMRGATASNAVDRALDSYREKTASIFVTASRRNNMLIVRTGDPLIMNEIRDLVKRLDVPTPMVLLEVRVLQLNISDEFASSFEYEFNKTYNRGSTETTGGFPGFNPLSEVSRPDTLSFQVLSDHLNARIQLLQKDGYIKTLATPTLLTANNEVSRLFIGEERPMVKNISGQAVVNESSVVATPETEIEFQPVGNMLLITPNINADRTVTLRLLQENSKIIKGDASIPVYNISSGVSVNIPVDVVSSRSVSGTFVARDEMTVAVGGLIEEEDSLQENKVPFLGSIPFVGWFFRSTEKVKLRTELIVLIKPHVISTPSEGEAISRRVIEGLSAHPARDGRPSMNIHKTNGADEKKRREPNAADKR